MRIARLIACAHRRIAADRRQTASPQQTALAREALSGRPRARHRHHHRLTCIGPPHPKAESYPFADRTTSRARLRTADTSHAQTVQRGYSSYIIQVVTVGQRRSVGILDAAGVSRRRPIGLNDARAARERVTCRMDALASVASRAAATAQFGHRRMPRADRADDRCTVELSHRISERRRRSLIPIAELREGLVSASSAERRLRHVDGRLSMPAAQRRQRTRKVRE